MSSTTRYRDCHLQSGRLKELYKTTGGEIVMSADYNCNIQQRILKVTRR
jgi:hypothetical protein